MTNNNTPDTTAVRTWNAAGTKATVTVTLPDGSTLAAGGARAARASAVVVARWEHDLGPRLYGLRADARAARAEADRLATQTTQRHRGVVIPVLPAVYAYAVDVEEAGR